MPYEPFKPSPEAAAAMLDSAITDDFGKWVQSEAIELCRALEAITPRFGAHVALTGGSLYKDGPRKDCDIVLYRIRQAPIIDTAGLWDALKPMGIEIVSGFGWCFKATYNGKRVEFFFPEEDGEYPEDEPTSGVSLELGDDGTINLHEQ
jgi:hypothetical protein